MFRFLILGSLTSVLFGEAVAEETEDAKADQPTEQSEEVASEETAPANAAEVEPEVSEPKEEVSVFEQQITQAKEQIQKVNYDEALKTLVKPKRR